MLKTKNKYRAFGYFGMAAFYYVAFAAFLLTGSTPRGDFQKDSGYFGIYISIAFLLFLFQATRGIYLYWKRLRRDTDPIPEAKSFSPKTAGIITSFVVIPIGLCFLILPFIELIKKTAYGGNVFGNHKLEGEIIPFGILLIFQICVAFVPIIGGILLFVFPPRHIEPISEIAQIAAQANRRPGMKTSTKIIIGSISGVLLLGFLGIAGIVGGAAYIFHKVDDPEYQKRWNQAQNEGIEFARTTDQNGCMEKGLSIKPPSDIFDVRSRPFIKGFLESSRPSPNFCEGVPSTDFNHWSEEECLRINHDTVSCSLAYSAKIDFCRISDRKPS